MAAAAPSIPCVTTSAPGGRRRIVPSGASLIEHGARLATIVAVACGAIFLDASTSYESSTALPYVQGTFAATPDEGSWLVIVFSAAYDTQILLSPWFLTRFGRRNYFVGSLAGFAVASLGCALAPSYAAFFFCRLLQGFALGGFFACGVLSLFRSIPDRLRLIGVMLFSMSSQMGSALGPAVAGRIVYDDAWPWVFVGGAAVALVLAVAIARVLRDPAPSERVPFDAVGAGLIATTFLALQYLVGEGERRNWTDDPWATLSLAIVPFFGAATLVWKMRFSPYPFLDFRVLRHRNLVVGAAYGFGFGILLQAATQIGGFVERSLGFTPALGGGLDALRAIAIAIFVPLVTFAIAEKILGVRTALLVGLAAAFAGFRAEVVATTPGADFLSFVLPFAGIGIGIAILYRALASVIFGTLPAEDLMMGLLVYKMSGLLGSAVATPLFATFLDHKVALLRSTLAGGVTLASPAVRAFLASGHDPRALTELVANQALALAYSDLWSLASVVAVALVPFMFLLETKAPTAAVQPEAAELRVAPPRSRNASPTSAMPQISEYAARK